MLRELWKELVLTTCWVLTRGPWCGSLPLLPRTPERFCGGSRSRGSEGVLIWAQAVVPQPMLLSCSSHGCAPGPEFCPGQQRTSTVPPASHCHYCWSEPKPWHLVCLLLPSCGHTHLGASGWGVSAFAFSMLFWVPTFMWWSLPDSFLVLGSSGFSVEKPGPAQQTVGDSSRQSGCRKVTGTWLCLFISNCR